MFRLTLFALSVCAGLVAGQAPPAGLAEVVKTRTEYTLDDGTKVVVESAATQVPALARKGAPCEVRAGLSPCQKCAAKAGGCDCVGGCPCEAKPVETLTRAVRAPVAAEQVLANQIVTPLYDTRSGQLVGYRQTTVREYVAAGGDLDAVGGMPEDHKAAVRGYVRSAPAPVVVVRPQAQPMPARRFQAGFGYDGPVVQFGAGACVGGQCGGSR